MGIENKQAYREYLKSEHWLALRNTVIEQTQGYCSVCFMQSALNDVHHILYPDGGWFQTRPYHLTTLCRRCHEMVHERMVVKQPKKKADCFRQFYKIRDELRSANPATLLIMRSHKKIVEIASRRPQPVGYERRPTRQERSEKRKAVKQALRKLSNEQIDKIASLLKIRC